jgi:hypothetical protein
VDIEAGHAFVNLQ